LVGDEVTRLILTPVARFQLEPPHVGSYVIVALTVQEILDEHIAKKLV